MLLSQTKFPEVSDHSLQAKPLTGKIIPNTSKSALIRKIVPGVLKEGRGGSKCPGEVKEIPTVVIKQVGKLPALSAEAKHAHEHASGRRSRIQSTVFISKAGETVLGSTRNQTATTAASGIKKNKLASTLKAVKGMEKTSKVREQGEVSEDSDIDQAHPLRPVKRMRGFQLRNTRRTSQTVALSIASFHKRQKKRLTKGMGASPEVGAEAGAQSGEEAAMPLECKAADSSERRTRRKCKSVFGHRRKPVKNIKPPKPRRRRTRHVFYTYVTEPNPTTTQDENKQLPGQNITASEGEPSLFSEHIQPSSKNSTTTLMSARSSRIIKTPKRFLDEDDCKETVFSNRPCAVTEFSSPSPGTSHLEIYENLKKLTLKLAEKRKGQPDSQGEYTHHSDSVTSHIRKRRRSKLKMEEMDSPGVVRKLSVVVNSDIGAPTHKPFDDIGNNSKNPSFYVIISKDFVTYA